MPQRSGLGKGLDALIPGGSSAVGEGGASQVSIDAIARNPRQPRHTFKEAELEELAASIREYGVIQPLIVSYVVSATVSPTESVGATAASIGACVLIMPTVLFDVCAKEPSEELRATALLPSMPRSASSRTEGALCTAVKDTCASEFAPLTL